MHAVLVTLLCWTMIGAACFFSIGNIAVPAMLAVLVGLLGLPHGAADHRFAQHAFEPLLRSFWLPTFLIGYLGIAISVGCGWYVFPAATIVGFFLISAWHFGQEEPRFTLGPRFVRPLSRFARGGLVIWVSLAFRSDEVISLLSIITPGGVGGQIELAMQLMGVASWCMLACASAAWVLQSLIAVASTGRKRRVLATDSLMQASLVLLFATTNPVVSFLVYFCAWHSARGLRQLRRELNESWRQLAMSLTPMTTAAIGLVVIAAFATMRASTWDETLTRSTFVGLSAVAVPHIVLHGIVPFLGQHGEWRSAETLTLGRSA